MSFSLDVSGKCPTLALHAEDRALLESNPSAACRDTAAAPAAFRRRRQTLKTEGFMLELLSLLQQGQAEQQVEGLREALRYMVFAIVGLSVLIVVVWADMSIAYFRLKKRLDTLEKDAEIDKRVKAAQNEALKS